jgi:hypothetical protein
MASEAQVKHFLRKNGKTYFNLYSNRNTNAVK